MAFITGNETPAGIIPIAYGMEEGLRIFYMEMSSKVDDKASSDLFQKLSDIEAHHKDRLFRVYKSLEPNTSDLRSFETQILKKTMEGGLTMNEFLAANQPALQTPEDILNMAMSLETQSLDLYLRYSQKSEDSQTKEVLYKLGDEEKAHLSSLGEMLEKLF
jgi:rubrerythrin